MTRPSASVPSVARWSALDVIAHVAADAERNLAILQGRGGAAPTASAIAEMNEDGIRVRKGRSREELLADTRRAVAGIVSIAETYGGDPPSVAFDGGVTVRADVVLAILLGELVVHGYDLSRATSCEWSISSEDASLIADGALEIMDGFTTPRAARWNGTVEIRIRGGTATRLTLAHGRIQPSRQHVRPDAVLEGTAEAVLLTSYRRRSPLPYIARGKLTVRGRRPWLAVAMPLIVRSP